ncbi:MAG: acetylglutamate kinase [Candidatus Omnitrophica bacterium]|nr:acetylglutamate kinase [Candidatus Omnitrophota bacterium]
MENAIKKSEILIEALPYIKAFQDKFIVIKYGGSALTNRKKRIRVLEDIIFMSLAGMKPVIVHGGGPFISKKLKRLGMKSNFIDGLRVSGEREITVIQEVLTSISRRIAREIRVLGGRAQSISGVKAIKVRRHRKFDQLGYVGEIRYVDRSIIEGVCEKEIIPVISPLGVGRDKHIYNVNADQASAYVARALSAEKLALLTNVDGIYRDGKDIKSLISSLKKNKVRTLIDKGVISTGMIPKVKACVAAIGGGVKKAHIINGGLPHALLLEIFTDEGIGTEVVK